MINSAQEFSEIAEELPQKLQTEWSSFQEEVLEESKRLGKESKASKEKGFKEQLSKESFVKIKINNLRSKVIEINKDIEGIN